MNKKCSKIKLLAIDIAIYKFKYFSFSRSVVIIFVEFHGEKRVNSINQNQKAKKCGSAHTQITNNTKPPV